MTEVIAGANGVVYGVVEVPVAAAPAPAAFTARSCGVYGVPFVNPVMASGEVVVVLRIQLAPPSMLYSRAVMALPLLFTECAIASEPFPEVMLEIDGADGVVNGVP